MELEVEFGLGLRVGVGNGVGKGVEVEVGFAVVLAVVLAWKREELAAGWDQQLAVGLTVVGSFLCFGSFGGVQYVDFGVGLWALGMV